MFSSETDMRHDTTMSDERKSRYEIVNVHTHNTQALSCEARDDATADGECIYHVQIIAADFDANGSNMSHVYYIQSLGTCFHHMYNYGKIESAERLMFRSEFVIFFDMGEPQSVIGKKCFIN